MAITGSILLIKKNHRNNNQTIFNAQSPNKIQLLIKNRGIFPLKTNATIYTTHGFQKLTAFRKLEVLTFLKLRLNKMLFKSKILGLKKTGPSNSHSEIPLPLICLKLKSRKKRPLQLRTSSKRVR